MKLELLPDTATKTTRELVDRYAAARQRLMGAPQREPAPTPVTTPFDRSFRDELALITRRMARKLSVPQKAAMVLKVLPSSGTPRERLRALVTATAAVFQIPEHAIYGDSHRPKYVCPRQIAMAIAVEVIGLNLSAAGRAFGRDHTTVLHAHRKYGALVRRLV
jgi:chromosomal replication initiation ATPase DnaA